MTDRRPASLVATCDQWTRAHHAGTAVVGRRGELMLTWTPEPLADAPDGAACLARGLAVDRLCRVYRLRRRVVERQAIGSTADGLDYATLPNPVVVVGGGAGGSSDGEGGQGIAGPDFTSRPATGLVDPTGIAIDADDRLFLADGSTLSVLDLWSRRLLRQIEVATPLHPDRVLGGLASDGATVLAVLRRPAALVRLSATRGPSPVPLPDAPGLPADAEPQRVAVLHDGTPAVLFASPDGQGWVAAGHRPARAVGAASDLVVDAEGAVVIAPCPRPDRRATLRRLTPTPETWNRAEPLDASGYDGGGLVATADGRIGYAAADGFRLAVIGRVAYAPTGHCTTYRLDSGVPGNRWGRVLIEACLPDGTRCTVGALTSDDEDLDAGAASPPEPSACAPASPGTPPLPPAPMLTAAGEGADGGLHRRPAPATPWWRPDERFDTFEAPVLAPPGRYLWLTLRLHGNTRRSPRIREVRVEQEAHALLRRLPAVYAAEERQADFLHRYLAALEGLVHDLDVRARCRDLLVDPHGTPLEALTWLASFVGLVLDDRWAPAARRQLVAEIVPLYRRRGTVGALTRYLELFLAGDHAGDDTRPGVTPVIVEHFRLRGLGEPLLGEDVPPASRPVVGAGFRIGGAAAGDVTATAAGEGPAAADGGAAALGARASSTAHRFTVLVPRLLGPEEEAAVRHVLDTERPAHTTYVLCTVDAGMRVGSGLHIGLSTVVGPTATIDRAVLDRSLMGRQAVLGPPRSGIAVESARVGADTRVG